MYNTECDAIAPPAPATAPAAPDCNRRACDADDAPPPPDSSVYGAGEGVCDADVTWQSDEGRCAVVLYEVFSWLSGRQLAHAGATCRTWRHVASDHTLWRRLCRRAGDVGGHGSGCGDGDTLKWRQNYVNTHSGWKLEARAPAPGAQHAALEPGSGGRLAIVGDDGALHIWAPSPSADGWSSPAAWSGAVGRARGWSSAVRANWSPTGGRLLLVGALALADSWELLVIDVDEECCGRVTSRARCTAGASGCWADAAGGAFLSLELSVFAPALAATTVWLNAADQETQSEYAGVRAPLLRIFNEDGAHLTFIAVVQVPLDAADDVAPIVFTAEEGADSTTGVLVTGSGCRADAGGALCAWPLRARRPPPVLAAADGDLRERVRRRAAAPPPPDLAPPPPDEDVVRALCTPPDDRALRVGDAERRRRVVCVAAGAAAAALPAAARADLAARRSHRAALRSTFDLRTVFCEPERRSRRARARVVGAHRRGGARPGPAAGAGAGGPAPPRPRHHRAPRTLRPPCRCRLSARARSRHYICVA